MEDKVNPPPSLPAENPLAPNGQHFSVTGIHNDKAESAAKQTIFPLFLSLFGGNMAFIFLFSFSQHPVVNHQLFKTKFITLLIRHL